MKKKKENKKPQNTKIFFNDQYIGEAIFFTFTRGTTETPPKLSIIGNEKKEEK